MGDNDKAPDAASLMGGLVVSQGIVDLGRFGFVN